MKPAVFSPLEQSHEWMAIQSILKGRKPVVLAYDKLFLLEQEAGMGLKWLWGPGAPVLRGERDALEMEEALWAWARAQKTVFCRLEPLVEKSEFLPRMGKSVKDCYVPRDTLVLDLSMSEAELMAQMHQKGRYNIRQAEKGGVVVEKASVDRVGEFYELLKDTGGRDGFGVHPVEFYKAVLRELKNAAQLYLASAEGRVVAGIIVTYWEGRATYYFGASSSLDRKTNASYLLQWRAIVDAKNAGMKLYDFLGIAPEGDSRHSLAGVTQFKTRFGGKRVSYHDAQLIVFRPWAYRFYRLAKAVRAGLKSLRRLFSF